MKFYAGLDVGGTSGRVKFSTEDKTLIGEYLGEGCAFNTEGYELGREKYRKLMDAALSKYELTSSDCLGICIAASGIDSKEQEMQMRSRQKKHCKQQNRIPKSWMQLMRFLGRTEARCFQNRRHHLR